MACHKRKTTGRCARRKKVVRRHGHRGYIAGAKSGWVRLKHGKKPPRVRRWCAPSCQTRHLPCLCGDRINTPCALQTFVAWISTSQHESCASWHSDMLCRSRATGSWGVSLDIVLTCVFLEYTSSPCSCYSRTSPRPSWINVPLEKSYVLFIRISISFGILSRRQHIRRYIGSQYLR